MTDARYLVPLSALPFQPHGATLAWECKVCGWVWSPFTAPALSCEHIDGPEVVACLDLSAPPERDGIPERLDALGWALAVLAKRVGWSGDIGAFWWSDDGSAGFASDDGPDAVRFFVQIWPDTIGLSPADATRAIVAQALRTHVQTESP